MATSGSVTALIAVRAGILLSMVWNAAILSLLMVSCSFIKATGRRTQIGGYCERIPKGIVRVGINVGNCVGKKAADAYTVWNSVTRIMTEEVPPPQ